MILKDDRTQAKVKAIHVFLKDGEITEECNSQLFTCLCDPGDPQFLCEIRESEFEFGRELRREFKQFVLI